MRSPGVGTAAVLLGATVFAWQACKPLKVAHAENDTVFELRGRHRSLPCEQCHGPLGAGCLGSGKPEQQPTSCMACHAEDVPAPNHFAGQECFPCHTEEGWDVFATPTPPETGETGDTGTTGETGDTGPTTIPDPNHEGLTPEDGCWGACHEADRLDAPEGNLHWNDLLGRGLEWDRWDCAPCHSSLSWTEFPPEVARDHPVHTPHGMTNNQTMTPPPTWIFACTPCHTDSPPYKEFQCIDACHQTGDFPPTRSHYTYAIGDDDQKECLGCHKHGELDYDTPL
jgi:hypothetical protein